MQEAPLFTMIVVALLTSVFGRPLCGQARPALKVSSPAGPKPLSRGAQVSRKSHALESLIDGLGAARSS